MPTWRADNVSDEDSQGTEKNDSNKSGCRPKGAGCIPMSSYNHIWLSNRLHTARATRTRYSFGAQYGDCHTEQVIARTSIGRAE